MADKKYKPVGRCIYCGATELPLGMHRFHDEHIIPLAMGGNLVLPEASCRDCERVINRDIETPITTQEWGLFREKKRFPSRGKRKRSGYTTVTRSDGYAQRIPIEDHSTPVPLYLFSEARILNGLGCGADRLRWTMVMLSSHDEERAMQAKYPDWDRTHNFRAMPHRWARFLAKIAHGFATAELGIDAFEPFTPDIIRGLSDDYYFTVGGSFDIAPPVERGDHALNITLRAVDPYRLLVRVDIRLFSVISTPSYHVVVGGVDLKRPQHLIAFNKHRLQGKIEDVSHRLG